MNKHIALTVGAAALLTLAGCGSRDAERAAPVAASTEADATSTVSSANPATTEATGIADAPVEQTSRGGQEGSATPPPGN